MLGILASSSSRQVQPSAGLCLTLVLIATSISLLLPPTVPRSLPYTHPSGLLRILSSEQSVTGRIVVAEDYNHGFRFLRADHSLLGGVWIGEKTVKMERDAPFVRDMSGAKLGDSIYSTFVLQEAARFQERETPQENALIMYLFCPSLNENGVKLNLFIQRPWRWNSRSSVYSTWPFDIYRRDRSSRLQSCS